MLPTTSYQVVAETHYTVIAWSWHAWSAKDRQSHYRGNP